MCLNIILEASAFNYCANVRMQFADRDVEKENESLSAELKIINFGDRRSMETEALLANKTACEGRNVSMLVNILIALLN